MRIRINNIEFAYNSTKVLDNITFEVKEGENIYVIGPNGAGKTTLLKVISRILEPTKGVIYINGKDYRYYSSKEIAKIFSYVDPHISREIPSTVYEFLLTARYPHQRTTQFIESEKDVNIIMEISKKFNILHLLRRRLDQLSDGELQRVLIARAFTQEPKVLLLDEPSAFLDIRYKLEILNYIKEAVKASNIIAITAIHDLYLASLFADKIILINNGKVMAVGKPDEVFTNDIIENVYGVKVRIVSIDGKRIVIPIKSSGGM